MSDSLLDAFNEKIEVLNGKIAALSVKRNGLKRNLKQVQSDTAFFESADRAAERVPFAPSKIKSLLTNNNTYNRIYRLIETNLPEEFGLEDTRMPVSEVPLLMHKRLLRRDILGELRKYKRNEIVSLFSGLVNMHSKQVRTGLDGQIEVISSDLNQVKSDILFAKESLSDLKDLRNALRSKKVKKIVSATVALAKPRSELAAIKDVYLSKHPRLQVVHSLKGGGKKDLTAVISWVKLHQKHSASFKEVFPETFKFSTLGEDPSLFVSAVELAEGHLLGDVKAKHWPKFKMTAGVKRGIKLAKRYHSRVADIRRSLAGQPSLREKHLRALGVKRE